MTFNSSQIAILLVVVFFASLASTLVGALIYNTITDNGDTTSCVIEVPKKLGS